jgi:hypothetical protein
MNCLKVKLLTLLLFLFVSVSCFSQRIDSVLNNYYNDYQQEKIHLHFDRSVYSGGETIWFKAYLMAGLVPSTISKNLYVDWADENGNVLMQQVYPVGESGTTFGMFELPVNYASGILHVRAYTRWMQNFDAAFLYNKDIRVVHSDNSKSIAVVPAIVPSLQFFPEGGDAIAGSSGKIAFMANDQWGRPIDIKGEVQDSQGNKVAEIKVQHDGMGYFWLVPLADEHYTAKWTDAKDIQHQTPLPQAKKSGVVLGLSDESGKKRFTIQRSEDGPENLKQLHIVATMQQLPVYMATISLQNTTSTIGSIPIEGLSAGGLVVTLFNADWQPVAERITFVDNIASTSFTSKIDFKKKDLSKRGLNEMVIDIPDSTASNLSVSVTDAGLFADSTDNIFTRLLLTSDVRGTVYNAGYYFSDTSTLIKQQLDLVMLTHGWRRYNWDKIIEGKYPELKYAKDSGYFNLSGKVTGVSEKKLKNAGDLFIVLKNKDSKTQSQIVSLNNDGSFKQPGILLFDSTTVYYKFTKKPDFGNVFKFHLDEPDFLAEPKFFNIIKNKVLFAPDNIDHTALLRNVYFMDRARQARELTLQVVLVKAKIKSPMQKMDDLYVNNGNFKSNGAMRSYSYIIDDKIPILPLMPPLQGPVTTFVDEFPVDPNDPLSIPPINDIAYIKVFPAPFIGAPLNGSAIAYYTKKRTDQAGKSMPYSISKGYTPIKEFYLPIYQSNDSSNIKEDIRPTIYWNPLVLTNAQSHEITLPFYNNDVTHSFRIIIEGFNNEGKLTHIEKVVE